MCVRLVRLRRRRSEQEVNRRSRTKKGGRSNMLLRHRWMGMNKGSTVRMEMVALSDISKEEFHCLREGIWNELGAGRHIMWRGGKQGPGKTVSTEMKWWTSPRQNTGGILGSILPALFQCLYLEQKNLQKLQRWPCLSSEISQDDCFLRVSPVPAHLCPLSSNNRTVSILWEAALRKGRAAEQERETFMTEQRRGQDPGKDWSPDWSAGWENT